MNTDSTCLYLKVKAEDCGSLVNAEGGHGARSHLTALVRLPSGEEVFVDLDFHSRSAEAPIQHFVAEEHLTDLSAHAVVVHGSVCSTAVGCSSSIHGYPVYPAKQQTQRFAVMSEVIYPCILSRIYLATTAASVLQTEDHFHASALDKTSRAFMQR